MPGVYTLCKAVTKRFRTLEVYGCSATRDAMENFCACNQGNYNPCLLYTSDAADE